MRRVWRPGENAYITTQNIRRWDNSTSQRCSSSLQAHSLVFTFLCCISTSWAGQRSASITMPSSLRQLAGWEKGDTFLECRRWRWLMLCRSVFSPVKHGSFIGPLWPQQAEDWVSPWCSQILLNGHYAAQNEWGDNPRHLYSHLSTHIRITKGVCMRESSFA